MKRIKEVFNPRKITYAGKSIIVDTDLGKYVIKNKNKDVRSFFEYLNARSFENYPKVVDEFDEKIVYEYVDDIDMPVNQKAADMGRLLANLHYKTAYYKELLADDVKRVYENVLDNILYFENYYFNLFKIIETEEYMRPSYYLLIRNQSKIINLIKFLKDEIESWYNISINEEKTRVVSCHNNLSIDHFKVSNQDFFISWDNFVIDSPVLDLFNLYCNDYNKYDFKVFFDEYISKFELNSLEKKLLFVMISLPKVTYFKDDEMDNTIMVAKFLDYIYMAEKLIRPYYFKKEVK